MRSENTEEFSFPTHPLRADPTLVPSGSSIIPVVFFGGNGGSGWNNARWGNDFLQRYLETNTEYFDVYSFSYRGYEPNDEYGIGEKVRNGGNEGWKT